jgi:hypothetical protein
VVAAVARVMRLSKVGDVIEPLVRRAFRQRDREDRRS